MLKNILIKCAEILNRNDLVKCLKTQTNIDNVSDETLKSDLFRLVNYFNFVSNTIFEHYFNLTTSETVKSDASNIIHYHNLQFTPVKILDVYDAFGNHNVATVLTAHILTNKSKSSFTVVYAYLPKELKNKNSIIENTSQKIIELNNFSKRANHLSQTTLTKIIGGDLC